MFNQIGSEVSLSLLRIQSHGSYESQELSKNLNPEYKYSISKALFPVLWVLASERSRRRAKEIPIVYNRKAINLRQRVSAPNTKWLYHMIYRFSHCFYRSLIWMIWMHSSYASLSARSNQWHWIPVNVWAVLLSQLISRHYTTGKALANYDININRWISAQKAKNAINFDSSYVCCILRHFCQTFNYVYEFEWWVEVFKHWWVEWRIKE